MKNAVLTALPVLLAALIYFTGYVYVSSFYGYYHIDAQELDISVQDIVYEAFPALYTFAVNLWQPVAGALIGLALLVAAVLVTFGPPLTSRLFDRRIELAGIAIIALFAGGYYAGHYGGTHNAASVLVNLPTMDLQFRTEVSGINCLPEGKCWQETNLHLLTSSKATIFAVAWRPGGDFWTYRIPISEITFARAYQ